MIIINVIYSTIVASSAGGAFLQPIIDPPSQSFASDSWLGADVATSLSLEKGDYLWLFGDTLLGNISERKRYVKVMISNSVGINHCKPHQQLCSPIRKFYRIGPRAIFILNQPQQKFWPTAGQRLDKKLFISGYAVREHTPDIDIIHSVFILVDNPNNIPTLWRYHVYPVLETNNKFTWSSAAFRDKRYLYILGERCSAKQCDSIMSRIPIHDAEQADWYKRKYWMGMKSGWKFSKDPQKTAASIIGLPGQAEMSIEYNDYFGWYSLQIPYFGRDVHLYTANKLTCPWSDRGVIYTIHDAQPSYIYYGAKIHPELSHASKEIVFTYNSNLYNNEEFFKVLQNPRFYTLYIPQIVAISPFEGYLRPSISCQLWK